MRLSSWLGRRFRTLTEITTFLYLPILLLTVVQVVMLLWQTAPVFAFGRFLGPGSAYVLPDLFLDPFYEVAADTRVFATHTRGGGQAPEGWACATRQVRPAFVRVPVMILVWERGTRTDELTRWCIHHEVGHQVDAAEGFPSESPYFRRALERSARMLIALGDPSREPAWAAWADNSRISERTDDPVEVWADLFHVDYYEGGMPRLAAIPPPLRPFVVDYIP